MSRPQEHRVAWYATRPDELHDLDALQYAERSARYAIAQAESLAAAARGYLAALKAFQAERPLTPCHIDIDRKPWEK